MNRLRTLTLGCAAMFGMSCAGQDKSEAPPTPVNLGPPIVRENIVYTPMGIGSQGCVLYNIQVPGGQAPAAMAYQSIDGRFSYGRPERCVKPTLR